MLFQRFLSCTRVEPREVKIAAGRVQTCHFERSEKSLAHTAFHPRVRSQRCFGSLNMTLIWTEASSGSLTRLPDRHSRSTTTVPRQRRRPSGRTPLATGLPNYASGVVSASFAASFFGFVALAFLAGAATSTASTSASTTVSTHSMKAIGAESLWRGPSLMMRV